MSKGFNPDVFNPEEWAKNNQEGYGDDDTPSGAISDGFGDGSNHTGEISDGYGDTQVYYAPTREPGYPVRTRSQELGKVATEHTRHEQ